MYSIMCMNTFQCIAGAAQEHHVGFVSVQGRLHCSKNVPALEGTVLYDKRDPKQGGPRKSRKQICKCPDHGLTRTYSVLW